jgi:hypothetical protein
MALGVNIVSTFDSKGIRKAISDFGKLQGVGAKSTFALRTIDSAVSNGIKNVARYGGLAATGLGIVGFGLVKAAEAADTANNRLNQVAESMGLFGSQTQVVSERLQELAEKTALQTGMDANQIKMTQAKLLTFANLGKTAGVVGGEFDRATQAALDLAATGFGEASQNAVQLGKALQDPIKGITALARSGVTFTDSEKEKIKALVESGKMLEAQDTLLKAIETQVGGTAKATANSSDIMREQFRQLAAQIGDRLQPLFEKLLEFIQSKLVPFVDRLLEAFDERGFAGVISMVKDRFLEFTSSGGKVKDIILGLTTAIVILKAVTIAATIAQNLFNVSLLANPIGIAVAAIIAFAIAVGAAYLRFEGFRKVVNSVINFIIGYFEKMTNMWIKAINIVIKGINLFSGILSKVGINLPELGEIGEVSFGRIRDSAKDATKEVTGLEAETRRFMRLNPKNAPTPTGGDDDDDPTGAGGAGKTVETARQKMEKYIDALRKVTDAQRSMRDSSKGVIDAQRKLADANQKVSVAAEKFALITRGYPKDSQKAQEAIRATADATRSLRDATRRQTDSVTDLKAAEQALANLRNRQADPRTVADAERKLARSKFDLEEANFDLTEIENELALMRKDPNLDPVELRRKEIAYEEAKFAVVDATNAVSDAEADLAKVRDVSPKADELAKAERELEDAKIAVEDATLAVQDATIKQAIAQALETEILEGAKEGSEAYEEALRDLNDAKDAQREAIDSVSDALYREAEAIEAVREAERRLAEQRRNTPSEIISKAEQRFAKMPTQNVPVTSGGSAPSMTNNLTVNAGMGTNPTEVAQTIVDYLDDWTRWNGSLSNYLQVL